MPSRTTATAPQPASGHEHGSADSNQNLPLGAAMLVVEIVIAIVIGSFVKLVSPDISILTILFFRYALCLPLLFAYGFYQRGTRVLHIIQKKVQVKRTVTGLLGLTTWFLAVSHIDISMTVALAQTMTIFITVLAPLMLGESVGPRRWLAVLVGFIGVMILLQPGTEGWIQPGVIYGLASPFFAGLMFIYLRKLGYSDAPVSTALWYNCTGALLFGGLMLAMGASMPETPTQWAILVACGVLASFQQFAMALSHKLASATALAPVHYVSVPISIAFGILLFNETITPSFLIGSGVVIAAAYYILRREHQLRTGAES